MGGIYKIECMPTNKKYIGSAKNAKNRFRLHKYKLRNGKHGNPHLQNAWRKYGSLKFDFKIIFDCPNKNLLFWEKYWIKKHEALKNGFNINDPTRPNVLSGKEHPFYGVTGEDHPAYGRKHTEEEIKRMSESLEGRELSKEHRENISEAMKGKEPWNKGMGRKWMKGKGNPMHTHNIDFTGESGPNSKLNEEAVKTIKYLSRKSDKTQKEIANAYNITQAQVSSIKLGKQWEEVNIDKNKNDLLDGKL
jgi:group I intron endonuclease